MPRLREHMRISMSRRVYRRIQQSCKERNVSIASTIESLFTSMTDAELQALAERTAREDVGRVPCETCGGTGMVRS